MYKNKTEQLIRIPIRPTKRSMLTASTMAVYGEPMSQDELRNREIEETYSAMALLGVCTNLATDFVWSALKDPAYKFQLKRCANKVKSEKNRADSMVYACSARYGFHFVEYMDNVVEKFAEYLKEDTDLLLHRLQEVLREYNSVSLPSLYLSLYVSEIAAQIHKAVDNMFDQRVGYGRVRIACDPSRINAELTRMEFEFRRVYRTKNPYEEVADVVERLSERMADKNLVLKAEREVRPELKECSVCHEFFPLGGFPGDGDICMTCTSIIQERNKKKRMQNDNGVQ